MDILIFLFWFSLAILFYGYAGYGLLVYFLNNIRVLFVKKRIPPAGEWPDLALVIAAYNEEAVLEQKIINSLALDYPPGRLRILVVTDGSDDRSAEKVRKFPAVQLLHQPERKGKYAAIKRAMCQVREPVVVFSDANCMLNPESLKKMVEHYSDPDVGGVAGEKKILRNHFASAVGEAEGIYWQYESFMKRMDAELYTVTGASGELFSIRTELFRALDREVILDDFVISMQVCLQGYRIEYEPDAFATESPSASLAEEEKRKIRISSGAFQSLAYLKGCLNFFRHPMLAFQFFSRRLLRWVGCPLALGVLLVTNILLVTGIRDQWYNTFLLLQGLFYLFALFGWFYIRSGKRAGLFTIPFYFVFMNYCLVRGWIRFARRKQTALWEKSLRQALE